MVRGYPSRSAGIGREAALPGCDCATTRAAAAFSLSLCAAEPAGDAAVAVEA